MASPIVRGQNFGATETITATKLQNIVDNAAFKDFDGSTEAFNVSGSSDIGTCVKAGGLRVNTSTGQLSLKEQANLTALGNTSGSEAVPTAVSILDEDTMSSNSATSLATQQSIKAYIDSYSMKYSGSTGNISFGDSFGSWNLSSIVGSQRSLVIFELFNASTTYQVNFRTPGSSRASFDSSSDAGWGASGGVVSNSNRGSSYAVVTDASGIIEAESSASASNVPYRILSYQKLL